jgi:valyl-tRNA synthetase
MKELPKAYDPKKYEDDIYKKWEASGLFNPDVCVEKKVTDANASHFSIVLPPPNVTGTLHMGHAAMLAIEDVMDRYHRMKGDRTLWVPGTDHAAVATESKVEAKLIKEEGFKKPKEELGREEFLKRVNKFAQESHDTIVNQCKKMGTSMDWSREAYTLDEERSLAVRTVFKKMYDDGLIYRGYRVINWSVKGQSTCSDDELVYVERPAKLYYFKYSKDFPITIATTRPETKLGDTAVAVNPNDERYKKYTGQEFIVDVGSAQPLKIKIIADEGVSPEFGTGALGVTPAHSAIDFEMYVKQKQAGDSINLIQVIGEDGKMTQAAGKYAGLTVLEARERFVEYLREQNLLEKEEDIMQNVGTSDRFGDVVEALPKTQWFVDVNKPVDCRLSTVDSLFKEQSLSLKQMMQQVVKNGNIKIIPERFEKTYFHWIDNLRDWCISRQIWFGHRIPVWYHSTCPKMIEPRPDRPKGDTYLQNPIIAVEPPKTCPYCNSDLVLEGEKINCTQDSDTLDTWFSSGLWTFSTLGWPNNATDLQQFHPTSVLETGYDILFFWVARMILMTTYTLGEVPFKTVYLHGLVRDEQGRKMSKSLGNIINPLDMIEKYGTDATRLSLLLGNTPGNDMKLSEEKIAGFRNFTNKLWNISRFVLMNIIEPKIDLNYPHEQVKTLADKAILAKLNETVVEVTLDIEENRFSMAGEKLRDFTWGYLADWYLEIAKIEGNKSEILNYILINLLKLWHPFMPFVTETIWQEVYGVDGRMLMAQSWPYGKETKTQPLYFGDLESQEALKQFSVLQDIITTIRALRSDYKIGPAQKVAASVSVQGVETHLISDNSEVVAYLGRLESLQTTHPLEKGVAKIVGEYEVKLDFSSALDVDKEKVRLTKEFEETKKYVIGLDKKLSNEEFVKNAPPAIVEGEKNKLKEAQEKLEKISKQLEELKK